MQNFFNQHLTARAMQSGKSDALITLNQRRAMHHVLAASLIYLGLTGGSMAQQNVLISSEWGNVSAELADNDAARSLARQLPITISMRDHLRQEKTGNLPAPLPETTRQLSFSKGTLGLWDSDHFVIYYRDGKVPQPGIIILGQVRGDVSIFDRPGPVGIRLALD
jgi:hypothetical protein